MGRIFFWMNKPDPGIPDTAWAAFLDWLAAMTIVTVAVIVVLTVLLYARSARQRRIFSISDVFAPYTPMRWILLALAGAVLAGVLCLWQYQTSLSTLDGEWGVALQILLLNGVLSALLSYAIIVFVSVLTPAKFRYLPAPYLHRKKSQQLVRSGG